MRLGISVHNKRVSPVLDTACQLEVLQMDAGEQPGISERVQLPGTSAPDQAEALRRAGIDVLICGGLSREMAWYLNRYNIRVIPWIAGWVETVMNAYSRGELDSGQFAMPGCGRRRFQRRRHRGRRQRGNGGQRR